MRPECYSYDPRNGKWMQEQGSLRHRYSRGSATVHPIAGLVISGARFNKRNYTVESTKDGTEFDSSYPDYSGWLYYNTNNPVCQVTFDDSILIITEDYNPSR